MEEVKFGVAGTPKNFKGKDKEFVSWLNGLGLNAYEIQCTYGFKVSEEKKQYLLNESKKGNIFLSMHAPYFINMGSLKQDVALRSKESMKAGIELAKSFDCNRIIFHPGGGHENTEQGRIEAIKRIIDFIKQIESEVDFGQVRLYPEIAGKTSNLGSIEEIAEIVNNTKYCYPCIDIAHLHAREVGSLQTKEDIKSKLEYMKSLVGDEKFSKIHFHAYTIEYNDKGEVKHLVHGENMTDGRIGKPNLEDFVSVLKEMNITPWIISEALDSQELGAKYMKEKYEGIK